MCLVHLTPELSRRARSAVGLNELLLDIIYQLT